MFMDWRRAAVALSVAAALAGAAQTRAATRTDVPAGEIARAVTAYMQAIDDGALDRQMAFWSDDPAVTSAIMGEVWTGPARIRARSAEYVPVSKWMRNELGPVSVYPLGAAACVSVAPYRPLRRDPANEKLKPYELDSMLSLVWRKEPRGWRIVHEHVSVKVPPPGAE